MKIFKNRNRKKDHANAGSDRVAGWIAGAILKLQGYWVKGMEKLFSKLSPASRKVVLFATCFLMVAYCSVLVVNGFNKFGSIMIKPVAIIKPIAIGQTDHIPTGEPAFIKRIKGFRQYLDSLGQSADGRIIRDSILRHRPGLLDSIRMIETIYCSK